MNEELKRILLQKYSTEDKIDDLCKLYLSINVAVDYVNDCTKIGLAVLAIEYFHMDGKSKIPVIPINTLNCCEFLGSSPKWDDIVQICNSSAISDLEKERILDDTQFCNIDVMEEPSCEV